MPLHTASTASSALTPADALRAGTRLEDYEIDGVIARSAVAMVYRALDRRNDQLVAIKEFLPTGMAMRSADGRVVAREAFHEQSLRHGRQVFLEQARALEKLEHASLMPVLRVMQCHGTVYRAMPYCLAPTLLEYRQKMAAAPAQRLLLSWLEGLMGALALFHDQGLRHGAVSPGNILMLPDHRAVLLDSDAVHAAMLSERTRSMIASLAPCFAPQEQCEPAPDRPLGPWTDLYALAATLRFCISGELPGTFAQRPGAAPARPGAPAHGNAIAPAGVDAAPWRAWLDACLAEAGKNRPQNLAQLKKLLQAGGQPPPAASAKAGPARGLSTALIGSSAAAASGVERAFPKAAPPKAQALRDVPSPLQPPLPGAMSSPATPVAEGTDPADRATSQPQTAGPCGALPSAESTKATSGGARKSEQWRFRMAGMAALLMLAAIAAVMLAPLNEKSGPEPAASTTLKAAAQAQAPVAQHAAATRIVPIAAPRDAVARVELPSVGKTDAPAHTAADQPAPPSPATGEPASNEEKAKPIAPTAAGKPVASNSAARAATPRMACAGRQRYALLQCMNQQCAKRTWSKHEQCVRLRKENKL